MLYLKHDLLHFLSGSHYHHRVRLTVFNVLRSFLSKEFLAVFTFRIYSYCAKQNIWPVTFLLYQWSKFIFSIDIAPKAKIGYGLRIVHCSDIVIGPNVTIGNNCVLFNGTTMGKKNPGKKGGMPTVGDNVTIGAGAKLLGTITVGNNAVVGANSVVLTNVPPNSIAVGVPAKIKMYESA